MAERITLKLPPEFKRLAERKGGLLTGMKMTLRTESSAEDLAAFKKMLVEKGATDA